MAEVLTVQITAKDGATQVFRAVGGSAQSMGQAVESAGKQGTASMKSLASEVSNLDAEINTVAKAMTGFGAVITASLAVPLAAGTKAAWNQVDAVQQATVALRAYEKDADKVNKVLADLVAYARSDMGVLFQREDLFSAAQSLRVMGAETENLTRYVEIMSRSVGVGAGNWAELEQVIGRVGSTGQLTGVEFDNLTKMGFQLDDSLRNATVTWEELFDALDRGIPADAMLGQVNTIEGGIIRLQSAIRSLGTAFLQIDPDTSQFIEGGLGDQLAQGLGKAREVIISLQPAMASLGQVAATVGSGVGLVVDAFLALPQPIQTTIAVMTGLSGAALTAGGAFLLMVPKILEVRAALQTLRNSATIVRALTLAINPVTIAVGAAATGAYILWNSFQEGERAAKTLGEALKELNAIQEDLLLSGEDERSLAIQSMEDYIAHIQEAAEARKNAFIHGSSEYQWAEVERLGLETLGEAYDFYNHQMDISSEEADRLAAAQVRLGNAMADNRVDAEALSGAVEKLWMRFMTDRTYSVDQFIADLEAIDITQFRAGMEEAAEAATGLSAAIALIRPELQGLTEDFLAFNEIGEDDSFGERFLKTLGLDLATLSEIEVRLGRLRGAWSDIESDMPAPDASQEEWMAWVNQAERGTIEWQRRAQAANEARRAEAEAMKEGEKDAAQFTETLGKMVEEAQAAEEALNAAGAAAGAFAVEYSTEFAQLTEDFISGILDIANIDMADKVNMAGLGTDATHAAAAINDVGSALDSVLTIYGSIDAMASRMSQAGGIVDALFGPDGDPSDGVGPLRDIYDAALIDHAQFISAIEDGIAIQDAAAESELYLNKIRADQLPLLRETTEAYNEQIQAISEMGAQEQMVALGWMDSGMQGRVEQFTEMISLMNNFGAEGEAAMQQVIDGIVATDPVLTAMLEDLGLIEQQLDGSYTLSLDAEGAVSDIERLTASIDALTLALGGTPPSYDIDVTGVEDLEDAQALIDAMNDNDITVSFAVEGEEQAKQALRRALGDVGAGDGEGVTVPVTLQIPTDLPPLPEPEPVTVPISFDWGGAAGAVGGAVSGALGAIGDGEGGATVVIDAIDNASSVINDVISAASSIPESEQVSVSAPGATGATAELNAVTAAANAIPEIEVVSVVASGATEAANALNAVAAAANSIPSSVTTTVTTVNRTVNLGTNNSVLPGGRHGGMPGYAMGGVLFEGGEAGMEMAHFATGGVALMPRHAIYEAPRGTYIEPANSVGSIGGPSITVNVNGPVFGMTDLAEQVSRELVPVIADVFDERYRGHGVR